MLATVTASSHASSAGMLRCCRRLQVRSFHSPAACGATWCMHSTQATSKQASQQAGRARETKERQYPSSSRLPLFTLISHINGWIHMQRMFFLPYSQKPLRLQRMGRRAKSCLLHIQNPLSDDKVCLHSNAAPHSMRRWILLKTAAVGSLSPFIYLLSGFSAPLHQTQNHRLSLITKACSDCLHGEIGEELSMLMLTSCSSI